MSATTDRAQPEHQEAPAAKKMRNAPAATDKEPVVTLQQMHELYLQHQHNKTDEVPTETTTAPCVESSKGDDKNEDSNNRSINRDEQAAIAESPGKTRPARLMGTWAQWSGREGSRQRYCVLPKAKDDDMDDMDLYDTLHTVSPVPPCGDVDYTVVKCGYTSRIPLSKLPNAILATDGLWGPDQRDDDAEDDFETLSDMRFQPPPGAFLFKGHADLKHLMSFDHCGCFSFDTLFKVLLKEYMDENEKVHRILYLCFDTESG